MAPVVPPSSARALSATEKEERVKNLPAEARDAFLRFQAAGDPEDLDRVILAILADFAPRKSEVRLDQLPGATSLIGDTGIDSLALTEVVFLVEDLFCISITNEDIAQVRTLDDLRRFVRQKVAAHPKS